MRDRGVVLINALVIVLAISAIAAALLARSHSARLRAGHSQVSQQLGLYLDGIETLMPQLLRPIENGTAVHPGQGWAAPNLTYPIDRGAVDARMSDLQGRLNVNWLMVEDEFADAVFAQVFAELRLPQSLLAEIRAFVSSGGPVSVDGYLARKVPVLPGGGPLRDLEELRAVAGMTPAHFATMQAAFSALPRDTRLNLNTAPKPVLSAVLEPFPPELRSEILARDTPINNISELRQRVIEILETEEVDHLPFDRLTVSSRFFAADLAARLEGVVRQRRVIIAINPIESPATRVIYRWAKYD